MNFNNLKCRCGSTENWHTEWNLTIYWNLEIVCDNCGLVHRIANSNNYNCKVTDLIRGDKQ